MFVENATSIHVANEIVFQVFEYNGKKKKIEK